MIVIDAAIPDRADEAMETLVRRLAADRESFPLVFAPEADRFFVRNGLLYLDIDDLEALSDDLAESQAFLATLSRDPTLRGLETVLLQHCISAIGSVHFPRNNCVAATGSAFN